MLYLANAFSLGMLTGKEVLLKIKEVDLETVKSMLKAQPFMSAVGHESTARVLSKLLDIEIPFSRVPIKLQQRDKLIVFQLLTRLEEGRVLSEEELKQLQYKFFVVEVVG
jgi:hypothetical protein